MNKDELIKYAKDLQTKVKEQSSEINKLHLERRQLIKLAEEAGTKVAPYKFEIIKLKDNIEYLERDITRYKNEMRTYTGKKHSRK